MFFRGMKYTQKIQVKLGSISIPTKDEEISLMDWLNISYHTMRETRVSVKIPTSIILKFCKADLDKAEVKQRELEETLEQLQNSMDGLVKAKSQHDTEMLTNVGDSICADRLIHLICSQVC